MQPLPLKQIHPLWLRCCHWINAVTVAGMICSGWRIYNASPLFSFNYPAAWLAWRCVTVALRPDVDSAD